MEITPGGKDRKNEAIAAAALRYDGHVYKGANHGEAFIELDEDLSKRKIRITKPIEEGFVTTDGEFLDRGDAYQLAKKEGQMKDGTDRAETDVLDSDNIKKYKRKDETVH